MRLAEFLESALRAVGGRERVLGVRTYRATAGRDPDGARISIVRAAGGRIRIDDRSDGATTSVIVVGDAGVRVSGGVAVPLAAGEIAEIRRDARLAPRNLLAHAAEHALALVAPTDPDAIVVELADEGVRYRFSAATLLCSTLVDARRGRVVDYEDYRDIDGLMTPFLERITTGATTLELRYEDVAYNEELPESHFALDGWAGPA
jgi:hypothetical protein